jgi:peptidoglycan L-alanyl-D-glutamate endopeptidase CwlK
MRDINRCHPRLIDLSKKLVSACRGQGLIIGIGESFRTKEEQDALYAKGRTAPGNIVTNAKGSSYSSHHQWGTAFDIYRSDGKGVYTDGDGFFEKVGKIGKSIGLEWGGDWKSPVDKPHFQLPDWGSTTARLKRMYGTPEKFMDTWKGDVEMVEESKIIINGKEKKVKRILKDGTNYIAIRDIADNLGYEIGNKGNIAVLNKK